MFKIARIVKALAKLNEYGLDTVFNMIIGMYKEPKFCKAEYEFNNTIDCSLLEQQWEQALALCNGRQRK